MTISLRRSRLVFLIAFASIAFTATVHAADDPTFGTWALGQPAPGNLLATHSTLLRNGKILVVGGSSFNCCFNWGHEETRLYDIASGTWSAPLPTPAPYGTLLDAFCSAHAHDNFGGVIFQGGLLGYGNKNGHGIPDSARYDVGSGTFSPISGGIAHWYPTLVSGTGHIFIFPGGNTEPDGAKTAQGDKIQKLGYGANAWVTTGVSANTKGTYPRVSLMPDGKLFIASPAAQDRKNYFFDPDANTLLPAGDDLVPESDGELVHSGASWKGSGALLPLVPTGGGYSHFLFALTNGTQSYVKDLAVADPVWKPMGTRPPELGSPSPERRFGNATLLPTGQLLITGGVADHSESDAHPVLKPEVFDPETSAWLTTSPATVTRNYHGVALLLPDGRVWTASASKNHSGSECNGSADGCGVGNGFNTEVRVEIFTPWYVGRDDRPVVTGCPATTLTGGQQFDIGIGGSQGAAVTRVLLIRAGSVTHSFDTDQRTIQLDIVTQTASKVTVKSPYSVGAAPPGDYMLFALRKIAPTGFKQWVPSTACWTRLTTPVKGDGSSIWRATGTACSGNNCPGWQKLDNNTKTMALSAGGEHHEQRLYQLHNDGAIWRYTDVPCQNDSCPGWERLDNNAKTVAITSAGTLLYQLHNNGDVFRYTDLPCNGNVCPGWQRVDSNSRTVAIAAGGSHLYQLHKDGAIWSYTGTPCSGETCPGWQKLDNNTRTTAIAAADHNLYQLQVDGSIWRSTGAACSGDTCGGWTRLDRNTRAVAIAAANDQLYQLHNDGAIWKFTGTPCSGDTCNGWQRFDNNSKTVALAATGSTIYQLQVDGTVWRSTGTPCSGESCPGWTKIDANSRTGALVAADPKTMGSGDPVYQLHTDPIYQLHNDGAVWRYTGAECDGDFCPGWERLDNNAGTAEIVAAGTQLFQRHTDGSLWRSTGKPCNGDSCPGWQQIDKNVKAKAIAAGGIQLYQLHNDGAVWRYTGVPCSGGTCSGWQQLDKNPGTVAIAAAGRSLFQLHSDGTIWRSTGAACSGDACNGWQQVDKNAKAKAIVAAGNQLFQLHSDGAIWRYTGTPCSGGACPGWQQLDNNAKATAIVAGGNQLYQLHSDGRIWRHTGKPCSGTTCTGWERLDANTNTREIAATGNHLYQRHADGRIWRYTGTPCTGDSCPGWRQLDSNAKTKRIAAGGAN